MVRTQIVERDEQEDHRGKATRPEPADQRHGVPPQRRPHERKGHRRHPHDRQAQGGVGDEERVKAHRDNGSDQRDAEEQPDEVRRAQPDRFGELDGGL